MICHRVATQVMIVRVIIKIKTKTKAKINDINIYRYNSIISNLIYLNVRSKVLAFITKAHRLQKPS